jgi:hypothetical protein
LIELSAKFWLNHPRNICICAAYYIHSILPNEGAISRYLQYAKLLRIDPSLLVILLVPAPDWHSIKDFTSDLLHVHDQEDLPNEFRPKLARSIAQLRDDKQIEVFRENEKETRRIVYRQL